MTMDGEIQFGFDELFFSRTDEAGRIAFGNSVFQRVSIYDWDELIGKPHKIVRHPDTPRAVFWLLWDTIRQGRPIGAYVKNRAKDGRFYWVFAIVTQVEKGYISVRLRPSSPLFAVVKQEYAALAAAEARGNLSPAASAERLLARLVELGFEDYSAFMAAALGAELAARDAQLRKSADRCIQAFDGVLEASSGLLEHSSVIAEAYANSENVPFNFRVLAAQLGEDGAAIGIISGNYSQLSMEMKGVLDQFVMAARELRRTINEGYFLASTARVQREMAGFFRAEAADATTELAALDLQQQAYSIKARAGLLSITETAAAFRQSCSDMRRLAAGLEVTRTLGKVECSRHVQVNDRLSELLHDLESFQRAIANALKEIDCGNDQIQELSNRLLRELRAA